MASIVYVYGEQLGSNAPAVGSRIVPCGSSSSKTAANLVHFAFILFLAKGKVSVLNLIGLVHHGSQAFPPEIKPRRAGEQSPSGIRQIAV